MDARDRLRQLTVASPCTASWSAMRGDDAVRHCSTCSQNVYNLEKLTPEQVQELLDSQQRVCGRFFRRSDGTVITRDCSWVWADSKKRARSLVAGGVFVELGAVMGVIVVLLAAALLTVALFGDNIRKLFGSATAGALAGTPPASTTATTPKSLRSFGGSQN